MRLHELFEAPFTQPGTTFIVNEPNDPQKQPAINTGRSIGTASAPPTTITSPNAPNQIPQSASPTINTAQNGSNTANTAALAAASQQLTKGAPINLPMGPAKQPTQMKVADVSQNNATQGKTVTVADLKNPNAPQQTYNFDDMANMVANKGNV
jgi:hypothetical protein